MLFNLPLCGAATSDVESLPSYLHRMALEHGLFVGEFIRYLYSYAPELGGCDYVKPPSYLKPEAFISGNSTNSLICRYLEVATGSQIADSPYLVLGRVLVSSAGEIHPGFRWCPECFREMEVAETPRYFKLIWHMSAVSACPLHRTPLVDRCIQCGCDQTTYRKQSSLGVCQDCETPLSRREVSATDIVGSWMDIGNDLIELFRDFYEQGQKDLPKDGLEQSVNQLLDYYWTREREDEFYELLDRDELLAVVHGQKHLSLKSVRRLAYRLGISIYELLSGNAHQTSAVTESESFCHLPPSFAEESHKVQRNHRDILEGVLGYLREVTDPPSVREVADSFSVSIGYLQYRHPSLVARIVREHQDYVEREKLSKRVRAQSMALSYFIDERYEKCPQSRRQAYRKLREETGLPKFMLRRAIQTAYQAVSKN